MSATLDTLRLAKRFRDAGASDQLAEVFADVLLEAREADLSQLATKSDLAMLKTDLKSEIAELKADIFKWLVPLLVGQAALTAALVKLL